MSPELLKSIEELSHVMCGTWGVNAIEQLAAEIRRLQEYDWMYKDLLE
jgi:hypothetical protein